jgi:hypothetical protein
MLTTARRGGDVARDDVPVKLDAETVRMAKHVVINRRAKQKGLTLAEYLSELLKPFVLRDYEAEFGRPKGKEKGSKGGPK